MKLLKLFGLGANANTKKDARGNESGIGQFDELFGSPSNINFSVRRERILKFDGELVSVASMGDHVRLVKLLELLLAEVNMANSNVSRYVATPIKNAFPNTTKAEQVQNLYLDHNRAYIEIRRLCKHLIEAAPLLAEGESVDDFQMLDESQSVEVFGSLAKINDAIRSLETVWSRLDPFEKESSLLRKQSRQPSFS